MRFFIKSQLDKVLENDDHVYAHLDNVPVAYSEVLSDH